jgi:glycosyltransferase involved in cell wall biosynthesis
VKEKLTISNFNNCTLPENEKLFEYLRWNGFLSERYKLFYVATPKVACTSLKWWFADLEGYEQELRKVTESAETDPDLIIHDSFYKLAPNVTGLLPEALLETLISDAYFRFAVVRNPYKRIFSAWQSKLLLREPLQIAPYINCDFYNQSIKNAADIASAFEGFLEHIAANEAPNFLDVHWIPQLDLLRPDLINYSKLVKIENAKELSNALSELLGTEFVDPFATRNANESLIPYLPELITARSAELIRLLYSRDFSIFGYSEEIPPAKEVFSADQFGLAIKAIETIRGRNQRFGQIVGKNFNLSQAVVERDGQIGNLNQLVAERDGQIGNLNQLVAERDGQIGNLNQLVAERDGQIGNLNQLVAERDGQIGNLNQLVAERDGQIGNLNQLVAERDGQIGNLNQLVAERDGQIGNLNQLVAERDGQIGNLNQLVAERDGQIGNLNQLVAERDGQIGNLNQLVAERDGQIGNLNQLVAERDGQIGNLLIEHKMLLNSISWKITQPFRFVSHCFLRLPYKKIREVLSNQARKLWVRLPLSSQKKQQLKNKLFHKLPILFKWSKAYLSWQALNGSKFQSENQYLQETLIANQLQSKLNKLCSVVIPTKNGGSLFLRVLDGLQQQQIWDSIELVIVDSGSTDGTLAAARNAGARVIEISPKDFNHGATRDYGISLTNCEIVVLMVQDALPNESNLLEALLCPFHNPEVAGVYARQIPQPDADLLNARNLNNWLTGRVEPEIRKIKSLEWYDTLSPVEKFYFCNFDNVCSAIRKSVWQRHKFGHINFGEDIDWAERVIKSGLMIAYEPAATVIHSHDRPLIYEYKRTYVCHRKLYSQFGLHLVPNIKGIFRSWILSTYQDYKYISNQNASFATKFNLWMKSPILNLVSAFAQYQAAKDEASGRIKEIKGV